MLSPGFTSALGLYQALQHAAAHAPTDQIVHSLPDWRPADDGEQTEVYLLHTANGWHQPKIPAQTGVIAMHGPQRHSVGKLTFAFTPSPGVRSSFSVVGIRPRLLEMAEQVRKHWALYGGGPKPAIDKPVKRAVTWPASIIKVWLAQIEDRDFAGAMLTAENIGAKYYPGNRDSVIVLAAPVQVEGLPDGMCSVRRGDGRWVVADTRSGRAMESRGFGSRKAAEESALAFWGAMDDDRRANALHVIANHEAADTAAARAAYCRAVGIEDPAQPQEQAQEAPETQEPAPMSDCMADIIAAAAEPAPDFGGLNVGDDITAPHGVVPRGTGAIDCAYHDASDDGLPLSQPGQPAPVVAPPSGGSLYTPPAEAGRPPPAQTAQPEKPGGSPKSGAVLVSWPKPRRAARARSSPNPGIRWRGVAPPPVESWRIPPAEVWQGFTPWRAKDTGRWRCHGQARKFGQGLGLRGIVAPICGPPAFPALQARHHQRQQERHHGQL